MIGVYNYTVILTYLSLMGATVGIVATIAVGNPLIGIGILLFCAICDAFDGKVARSKKDRTQLEKNFGIQIDSLSDVIAFGVLPASIGYAMLRESVFFNKTVDVFDSAWYCVALRIVLFAILVVYVLAALVRLAYFNVTEEERQQTSNDKVKYYTGLPVTLSSFAFPMVMILHYLLPIDLTALYFATALFMAGAFVANVKIPKPGARGIFTLIGIGVAVLTVLTVLKLAIGY